MKYVNSSIVFQEIPDEVTLAINISNCPCRCPGCHSPYLWADTGSELTTDAIDSFMEEYGSDITCIAFMGGDAEPETVNKLSAYIQCQNELASGNGDFRQAEATLRATLDAMAADMEELDYFLKHFIEGFRLTVDELSR